MGPTLPINISGGSYLLPAEVDTEPKEEQPFDFSRTNYEVLGEPDPKDVSSEAETGQDDDMPRVYCTEGTPRFISRASSVGDLTGDDGCRPGTIYEQEEITLASQTATANATPRNWSRSGSPTSMDSFCMNWNSRYDTQSLVSEFSCQPSGLISPSDLPDSPSQTMPPSPKDKRPTYTNEDPSDVAHPFEYAYPLQSSRSIPHRSAIALDEVDHDGTPTFLDQVRPRFEFRPMGSHAATESLVGDEYTQEDSLHNYRTEDTPAILSAATSYSDLSNICSKSDSQRPVPKPRSRTSKTPLQGCSTAPTPLDLCEPQGNTADNGRTRLQHKRDSFGAEDQRSESSFAHLKPRPRPRKLQGILPVGDSHDRCMPDLDRKPVPSPSVSVDCEILEDIINKGRPKKKGESRSGAKRSKNQTKSVSEDFGPNSESDQQQILNELIRMGRPTCRNQALKSKSKRGEDGSLSSSPNNKYRAARFMESSNVSPEVTKKSVTNVQEKPIRRGGAVVLRSAETMGNHTIPRKQIRGPDPTEGGDLDLTSLKNRSKKPISKVNRSLASPRNYADEEPQESVSLLRSRSSVRKSRRTRVEKTAELSVSTFDANSRGADPPLPSEPPQIRAPPEPPAGPPEHVAAPEPTALMAGDVQGILPDIVPTGEENKDNFAKIDIAPEPPEDSGDVTVLSFKFAGSHKSYTRRFVATNQFQCVINYLAHKGFPSDKFKIVVPTVFCIKKEVTENSHAKTLAELKMVPKRTLTVKPR